MDIEELWARMEESVVALQSARAPSEIAPAPEGPDPVERAAKAKRRRQWRRCLDLVGALTWIYLLLKLFVFDVDSWALDSMSDGLSEVLKYRVFAVLVLLVLFAAFFRWRLLVSLCYVVFFPLVVLLWKLPYFIQKRRSWLAVVASAHILTNLFTDWRRRLIVGAVATISGLAILLFSWPVIIYPAMAAILAWFVWTSYRVLRSAVVGPTFLAQQNRMIATIMDREQFQGLMSPPKDLLKLDGVTEYSQEQVNMFTGKVSISIGINRALYFWAYQLQRYRRTTASIAFAVLDYVGLFVRAVVAFGLLNWGLYKILPAEYAVTGDPGIIHMCLYAMSRLAFSDGGGVAASGDLASLLALMNGFVGFVVLAAVGLSLLLTLKPDRDAVSADHAVAELKRRARSQEAAMKDGFNVDVAQAIVRLSRLGQDVSTFVLWMTKSIPADFYDDVPDGPGDSARG